MGTSVLQLSVIDKDASHNGPPFNFRILSGNEGAWFKLDREGLLTSNQVFRRSEGTEYIIHVQVMLDKNLLSFTECKLFDEQKV